MTKTDAKLWADCVIHDGPVKVSAPYSIDYKIFADSRGICMPAWTTDPSALIPLARKLVLRTLYSNGVVGEVVKLDPLVRYVMNGFFANENPKSVHPRGKRLVGRCCLFCFPYADEAAVQWFVNAQGVVDYHFPIA